MLRIYFALAYGAQNETIYGIGVPMIFAVAQPSLHGRRFKKCDILIFEQVSTRESRVHEGLLQMFMHGPAYPEPQWVTLGRLLGSAETWDEMREVMRAIDVKRRRIAMIPAWPIGGL